MSVIPRLIGSTAALGLAWAWTPSAQQAAPRDEPARLISQAGRSRVWAVAFSPDGKLLASAEVSGARLWDVERGRQIRWFRHASPPTTIAYSADGLELFVGHLDGTITVWDPKAGTLKRQLATDKQPFGHLAISSDNRLIARTCGDFICIVSASSGQTERRLPLMIRNTVLTLKFLTETRLLVGTNSSITEWDAATGRTINEFDVASALLKISSSNPLGQVIRFSHDGTFALIDPKRPGSSGLALLNRSTRTLSELRRSADAFGFVAASNQVWILDGGSVWTADESKGPKLLLTPLTAPKPDYFSGEIASFASTTGLAAFVSDNDHERIRIVELPSAKTTRFLGATGPVIGAARFVPDGRHLAVASGKFVTIWDLQVGRPMRQFETGDAPEFLTFSDTNRGVFWGGPCSCLEPAVWDGRTNTTRPLAHQPLPSERKSSRESFMLDLGPKIEVAAIGDEGSRILTVRGRSARVRDFDSLTERRVFETRTRITHAAISPNATMVATVDGNDVALWDVETGKRLSRFNRPPGVSAVLLPNNGDTVLLATETAPVSLYDVRGRALRTFGRNTVGATLLRTSSGGSDLLSVSSAGIARASLSSGIESMFVPTTDGARVVDLSPDGKWVIETQADGLRLRRTDASGHAVTLVTFDDGSWAARITKAATMQAIRLAQ